MPVRDMPVRDVPVRDVPVRDVPAVRRRQNAAGRHFSRRVSIAVSK